MDDIRTWLMQEISKVIIAFMVIPILIFFRKLPEKLVQEYRARRSKDSIHRDKQIMYVLSDLSTESEAIYVHIIKYIYNGGPQRMGVEYEEPGHACLGCNIDCVHKNGIERIQHKWEDERVRNDWKPVVEETINRAGKVNSITNKGLSNLSKQQWEDANIKWYTECLVKYHSKGFYALGLSFCPQSKNHDKMDAKIWHAARSLEKCL
jgi:hypothetical protein